MPPPRSKGPNMCPMGAVGVIGQLDCPPCWSHAAEAFAQAFDGVINIADWLSGTYPPDLGSIFAFEV